MGMMDLLHFDLTKLATIFNRKEIQVEVDEADLLEEELESEQMNDEWERAYSMSVQNSTRFH